MANTKVNSGGSKGSKFFQFHAVFGKVWQNRMLASPPRQLAPPPRGNPGSATGKDRFRQSRNSNWNGTFTQTANTEGKNSLSNSLSVSVNEALPLFVLTLLQLIHAQHYSLLIYLLIDCYLSVTRIFTRREITWWFPVKKPCSTTM